MRKNPIKIGLSKYYSILLIALIVISNYIPLTLIMIADADLTDASSLQDRGPIVIGGNGQFTISNGVIAGSGNATNPYIIENWTINASDYDGIWILNTDAHFIIRNCYIYDGKSQDNDNDGIYLYGVNNGTIENNRLNNNYIGIYLSNSNNVAAHNNSIDNSSVGIEIEEANSSIISNNYIIDCLGGVYIDHSHSNMFINNTIIHAYSKYFFKFHHSSNNHIINNTMSNGWGYGVYLHNSNNTQIYNNLYNNSLSTGEAIGIEVSHSYNASIHDNILMNAYLGIDLSGSNNSVYNNTLTNFTLQGIRVDHDNNFIYNNSISKTSRGIHIYYSDKNVIYDNNIFENGAGLDLTCSKNNELYNNTLHKNNNNIRIGCYPRAIGWYNHIITRNNTVDDKPIYYWTGEHNKSVPKDAGFVGLVNCSKIRVANLSLEKNGPGLLIVNNTNTIIEDTNIKNTYIGILLHLSKNTTIRNNIVGDIGNQGINLRASNNNTIHNNTVYNSSREGGLYLLSSNDNEIFNNIVYDHSWWGIGLDQSNNNNIFYNTAFNNSNGMRVDAWSNDNHIHNNTVHNNGHGIKLRGLGAIWGEKSSSINNCINNNTIFENKIGIEIINIEIVETPGSKIFNNRILDNEEYGLFINNSENNTIFNNYFSNNNDTYEEGQILGKNNWNISKTLGDNIVGGPYLGGNYWSIYLGKDINGDFLGDTEKPFGPGDLLPLIPPPPLLMDETQGNPFTGDVFIFNASSSYLYGVRDVFVNYWFDAKGHTNMTMERITGSEQNGYYSFELEIPTDVSALHYFMSASNIFEKWNVTPVKHLVTEKYTPVIEDLSGIPATGDNYTLSFRAEGFLEISDCQLEYWFDSGNKTLIELLNFTTVVQIPTYAHVLHYLIKVEDVSNNTEDLEAFRNIIDNDPPVVDDLSGDEIFTNESYLLECNATDNWKVENVTVEYWFDGDRTNGSMVLEGGRYAYDLTIPANALELNYVFKAYDRSGNLGTQNGTIAVIDNIKPEIKDLSGTPTTGDEFIISVYMTDNVEVVVGSLEYWVDVLTHYNVSYDGEYGINISPHARTLSYLISCSDNNGNVRVLEKELDIKDNDAPIIQDLSQNKGHEGGIYRFIAKIEDNIEVKTVYVEYWFKGEKKRMDLDLDDGYYRGKLKLPKDINKLNYSIHAEDKEGNYAVIQEKIVKISPSSIQIEEIAIYILVVLITIIIIAILWIYYYRITPVPKKIEKEEKETGFSEE